VLAYVHIPFCHRICPYCSFYKHTPGATPIGRFIAAVLAEARARAPLLPARPRTLYLGGGTPSMLSPGHLTILLDGLRAAFGRDRFDELTLEANPATFDAAKARRFVALGVTRVSLGIQSFDQAVLTTLGREHSPDQARTSADLLRAAGLPSLNIDLMFAVPGQSLASWRATVAAALALGPDHVSAYNLTYEEDTVFFEALGRGELHDDSDHGEACFEHAHAVLTESGLRHYETSNYARPGHESTHNRGYWQGEEYLGLGPSAVSTIGRRRTRNVPDTARYIALIEASGHAVAGAEDLDDEALRLERIALLLRTDEGLPLDLLDPPARRRAVVLAAEGLAEFTPGAALRLIARGRALVDPIAAELA
jgi:oxygen-independent coproporphyrinogen-3 oxidase